MAAMEGDVLYRLVGQRIRAARRQAQVSQAGLAERLGLSRVSVVNIEAGRQRAPLHVLWQIAEALGTEVSLLIPSQADDAKTNQPVENDEQMEAKIQAASEDNELTRRLLTEFIGRVQARPSKAK